MNLEILRFAQNDDPTTLARQQFDGVRSAVQSLSSRRLILAGGKGGVGKTTVAALIALELSRDRDVILFASDPASNLGDLFGESTPPRLTIEEIDADQLYRTYLEQNLPSFLELTDRGTYLDKEEVRRFFELALPGVDELMAWMRIGELTRGEALVVVDTAPTGHTLRMLASSQHFQQFENALETMQGKHRMLVEQLSRRELYDEMDRFLEKLEADEATRGKLLTDSEATAFIPVTVAEPLITEQTIRLSRVIRERSIDVPFVVLNQTATDEECAVCDRRRDAEQSAREALRVVSGEIVNLPRVCRPIWGAGVPPAVTGRPRQVTTVSGQSEPLCLSATQRLIFVCGKGGVGKTSSTTSVALQQALGNPSLKYLAVSVDPAHSLPELLRNLELPPNLTVESIDTRGKWQRLRDRIGGEIRRAIEALAPRGMSLSADEQVMEELLDIAPPGADEMFAIMHLADSLEEEEYDRIFVDTAPTGHFLRLVDLPRTAGEWVREFMRLLLKYRDLVAPGELGLELVKASKSLSRFEAVLQSDTTAAVVVTRPEPIILAESRRLIESLRTRQIAIAGVIVNYLTAPSECACDAARRSAEAQLVSELAGEYPRTLVERQSSAPASSEDLRQLVPMRQTGTDG